MVMKLGIDGLEQDVEYAEKGEWNATSGLMAVRTVSGWSWTAPAMET
jgi:hypothetical protein